MKPLQESFCNELIAMKYFIKRFSLLWSLLLFFTDFYAFLGGCGLTFHFCVYSQGQISMVICTTTLGENSTICQCIWHVGFGWDFHKAWTLPSFSVFYKLKFGNFYIRSFNINGDLFSKLTLVPRKNAKVNRSACSSEFVGDRIHLKTSISCWFL